MNNNNIIKIMINNLLELSADNIKNRIYTIRNMQVMLDKDLAELYEVKAIRLREQVKRNNKRFPSDFMFQLTDSEVEFLVSQNAIPSKSILVDIYHMHLLNKE